MPRQSPQKSALNRHTVAIQLLSKLESDGFGNEVYGTGFTKDGRVFVIGATEDLVNWVPFQFHGRDVVTLVADSFPEAIKHQTSKPKTEVKGKAASQKWEREAAAETENVQENQIWMNKRTRRFARIGEFGEGWVTLTYTGSGKTFSYNRGYFDSYFELYKD